MARIRTIKPELFRHEGLQDLAKAHGVHVILVFQGLFCFADREGRFPWKPRILKLDILPFLDFDMEEALDALTSIDCITRYEVNGTAYGMVNNWARHQLPGRDEPPSEIPSPDGGSTDYDRPPNSTIRSRIYERDGFKCVYCGFDLTANVRARCVDHVIPYSKGGKNTEENLVTCCKRCNAKKGKRTPEEAGMPWPNGIGERYVNGALTVGQQGRDMERERGGVLERGWENTPPIGGSFASENSKTPLWNLLCEIWGFDPKTQKEFKRIEALYRDFSLKSGGDLEKIQGTVRRYARVLPAGALCTPEAVLKHWDTCQPQKRSEIPIAPALEEKRKREEQEEADWNALPADERARRLEETYTHIRQLAGGAA